MALRRTRAETGGPSGSVQYPVQGILRNGKNAGFTAQVSLNAHKTSIPGGVCLVFPKSKGVPYEMVAAFAEMFAAFICKVAAFFSGEAATFCEVAAFFSVVAATFYKVAAFFSVVAATFYKVAAFFSMNAATFYKVAAFFSMEAATFYKVAAFFSMEAATFYTNAAFFSMKAATFYKVAAFFSAEAANISAKMGRVPAQGYRMNAFTVRPPVLKSKNVGIAEHRWTAGASAFRVFNSK